MTDLARLLAVARAAAQLGTDIIRASKPGSLTLKGDRDYASEIDFTVERELRTMLREATPDIGFLGEEEGFDLGSRDGPHWVLDPIDGTVNFTNDIPLCALSLALVNEGVPTIGVIQLPYLNRVYAATNGHGATRDDIPITVSRPSTLAEAVVSIGDYAVGDYARLQNRDRLAITQALAETALRVRMLGSAAIDLAWLAQGSTGATIMLSNKPWDTAAGVIIAREAGAVITDIDGSGHTMQSNATIAAAPTVADRVLDLIEVALSQPRKSAS